MQIISEICSWLGYTIGTSTEADTVVYAVSGCVVLLFVLTIISLITRILNITFFRGKE